MTEFKNINEFMNKKKNYVSDIVSEKGVWVADAHYIARITFGFQAAVMDAKENPDQINEIAAIAIRQGFVSVVDEAEVGKVIQDIRKAVAVAPCVVVSAAERKEASVVRGAGVPQMAMA